MPTNGWFRKKAGCAPQARCWKAPTQAFHAHLEHFIEARLASGAPQSTRDKRDRTKQYRLDWCS